jgi:hypothetical protein
LAGKDRESSGGLSQNDLGTSDDEGGHDSLSDLSSLSESDDSDTTSQRLAKRWRRKQKRLESRRRRRERFAVSEGLFEKPISSFASPWRMYTRRYWCYWMTKGLFRHRRCRPILIMPSTRH